MAGLIFFWQQPGGGPPAPPPPPPEPGQGGRIVAYSGGRMRLRPREEWEEIFAAFEEAPVEEKRKIVRRAVAKVAPEKLLPPELRPFARVPLPQVRKTRQIDVAALVRDMAAVKALLIAAQRQAEEDDDEEAIWLLMN